MRPVMFSALLATALSVNPAKAQDSSESNAKAAKKKHVPTAIDALIENGPERPHALEEARREAAENKAKVEKSPEAATSSRLPPGPPPLAPVEQRPTVQAVPPGPPQKDLTGEEFARIRVGSTEKEVFTVLGPPSSRVVVPDDNGHLRESLQYWVKGNPMGTVRLDNGRVVQIETKPN
jgi:hypothetical protein